jgi:hypothetical protein
MNEIQQSGRVVFSGSSVGTPLQTMLMSDGIEPGSDVSYELCKIIYMYHPMGAKMVEYPIDMAMSKPRIISVKDSPGDDAANQFNKVWKELNCDCNIKNLAKTSAIYGIASIAYMQDGNPSNVAIPLNNLAGKPLKFNVFDPLNTSGSLVLSQNPLDPNFQKPTIVSVQGQVFHPSRTCVLLNEEPIYIKFTSSAFGFVGRSVYQRALYPMKTFIQTMVADDLVSRKAGVIISKQKSNGSFVDNVMQTIASWKRNLLNVSGTGNTISIDIDESIETLDLQNVDKALITSRKNCIENIALAMQAPAKILNAETMAQGFGEGTEDAKNIARYVDARRAALQHVFEYFDEIVMHTAWTPGFFETMKKQYPSTYKKMSYQQAFSNWKNSFKAEWENFLIEPDSEKIKTEDIKLKAIISLLEKLLPELDPENKSDLIQWAIDNFNEQNLLFVHPLMIDTEILKKYLEENRDNEKEFNKQQGSDGGLGELGSKK